MTYNSRGGFAYLLLILMLSLFFVGGIVFWMNSGSGNQLATTIATQSTTTLATPTNLAASKTALTKIHLTWEYNGSGQTGFEIESTTDPSCTSGFANTGRAGKSSRSFNDGNLSSTGSYCYRVRAFAGSGSSRVYSAYSNTAGDFFSFTLTPQSPSVSVEQSRSVGNRITVSASTNFSGSPTNVSLYFSGLPSGTTAFFNPSGCVPVSTCGSSLNITTSPSTPIGTYKILVWGSVTDPSIKNATVTFDLVVTTTDNTPPEVLITNPIYSTSSWYAGQTFIVSANVTDASGIRSVDFSDDYSGLYSATSPSNSPVDYRYLMKITSTSTIGRHSLYVTARDNSGNNKTVGPIYYYVVPVPTPTPKFDFSLISSVTSTAKVSVGGTLNVTMNASLISGSSTLVTFYPVNALPSKSTSTFSVKSCTLNCSTVYTLKISSSTSPGVYNAGVQAVGGGINRSRVFQFEVTSP